MDELAGSNTGCVNWVWLVLEADDGKLVWRSMVGSAMIWMVTLSEREIY